MFPTSLNLYSYNGMFETSLYLYVIQWDVSEISVSICHTMGCFRHLCIYLSYNGMFQSSLCYGINYMFFQAPSFLNQQGLSHPSHKFTLKLPNPFAFGRTSSLIARIQRPQSVRRDKLCGLCEPCLGPTQWTHIFYLYDA